jgi:hypothetical protein
MRRLRGTVVSGAVLLMLATIPLHGDAQAPATQAPADPGAAKSSAELGRPSKSVRGKLESVDASLNGAIMRSDDGKRMAWKFEPPVIAELAKFKPGDPMIVIYRQISANEKRVTAVAFPGTAEKPTYVNMTGSRIVMRSGPAVNGACGTSEGQAASENTVPDGGIVEALDACWCCSTDGESCTPANRTGNGKAVLVSCFK